MFIWPLLLYFCLYQQATHSLPLFSVIFFHFLWLLLRPEWKILKLQRPPVSCVLHQGYIRLCIRLFFDKQTLTLEFNPHLESSILLLFPFWNLCIFFIQFFLVQFWMIPLWMTNYRWSELSPLQSSPFPLFSLVLHNYYAWNLYCITL